MEPPCQWTYRAGDDFKAASPNVTSDSAYSSEGSCYQQSIPLSGRTRHAARPADPAAGGKDGALASLDYKSASLPVTELAHLPLHSTYSPPLSPWALSSSSSCPTSPATSTTNADDLGDLSPFISSKCSFGDDLACLQTFRFPPFERPVSPKTVPQDSSVSSAANEDTFVMQVMRPERLGDEQRSHFSPKPPSLDYRRRSIVPLPLEGVVDVPDPPTNAVDTKKSVSYWELDPTLISDEAVGYSTTCHAIPSRVGDTPNIIDRSEPRTIKRQRSLSSRRPCKSPLRSPSSLSTWSRKGSADQCVLPQLCSSLLKSRVVLTRTAFSTAVPELRQSSKRRIVCSKNKCSG